MSEDSICEQVLDFWFQQLGSRDWFRKDPELDDGIAREFGGLHRRAGACELYTWRSHSRGRLAEILVLDQFSRNIYRDNALAFAWDPLALALAQEAVDRGFDRELPPAQRVFLYMPYMHSESLVVHQVAEDLFRQPGLEDNFKYEIRHKEIIERFGRYPHRNAVLGRESTEEEKAFLQTPGSGF